MSKIDGSHSVGDYKLTFNVNALCDLEEAFGVDDVNEVVAKINTLQDKPSLRLLRTIFHVGFKQNHPDITEQQVGEIITEIGLEDASEALGQAIQKAFPDAVEETDGEGDDSGKPKGAGTGKKP